MHQLSKLLITQFINSLKMKNKKPKLGCYVEMHYPNYLLGSVNDAINFGANCFMFYTRSPCNFQFVPSLKIIKIEEFKNKLKLANININDVIIHAPYAMNLASDDLYKRLMAKNVLENEIKRAKQIGVNLLIIHPGNNANIDLGCKYIAQAINKINQENKDVTICLETMSGKGTEIGSNFNELKKIINLIENKNLIGVCLDTCHLNDSGIDVSKIDMILTNFANKIGLNFLKVIHLNDSLNFIGTKKDRHANIDKGTIGKKTLQKWLYHPLLSTIPKILESPYVDKKPIYKNEIKLLLAK